MAQALSDWTVSEILRSNEQQKAIGAPGMTDRQVSAAVSGALEADYTAEMNQAKSLRDYQLAVSTQQQEMQYKYYDVKAQERAAQAKATMEGIGGLAKGVATFAGTKPGEAVMNKVGGYLAEKFGSTTSPKEAFQTGLGEEIGPVAGVTGVGEAARPTAGGKRASPDKKLLGRAGGLIMEPCPKGDG